MADRIDKVYEDAVSSGLLPGVSVIAGDRDGKSTVDMAETSIVSSAANGYYY
jgi:hypothetical protein